MVFISREGLQQLSCPSGVLATILVTLPPESHTPCGFRHNPAQTILVGDPLSRA